MKVPRRHYHHFPIIQRWGKYLRWRERLGLPAQVDGGFRNGCKITPDWILQAESKQPRNLHGRLWHTMPTSMESYGEANPLGICLCSFSAYILSSPESLLILSWMRLDPGPCELQLGSSSTLLRLQGSGTISGPFQQSPEKMVGEEQGRSCDPGVSQASSVLSVTVSAFFFFSGTEKP